MATITKLSPQVIAKIAAGEVIERPMYVVKELVENAIDAKATQISIELTEGGIERIRITDNGEGMDQDNLQLCYQRYTTSKTTYDENLLGIQTLGFRGEALYSIATVSNLTIQSRTAAQKTGLLIENTGQSSQRIRSAGMPLGTQIIVENLFKTIPARLKFLKSSQYEAKFVTDIVTHYSLCYPQISFFLTNNNRTILELPAQPLLARIKALLGDTIYQNLLPVNYDSPYLKVSGFLGKPQIASHTTKKSYLLINQRSVKDKLITSTIKDTYGSLLEPLNQPVFLLFLEIPFELVDVNVHPRKEEVKYLNQPYVLEKITEASTATLASHNLIYRDARWKRSQMPLPAIHSEHAGHTDTYAAMQLKEEIPPWHQQRGLIKKSADVIQLHNLYLITETKQGILILDQHAAHERLLYEQFKQLYLQKDHTHPPHTLSEAKVFSVSLQEYQLFQLHRDQLTKLGFEIEEFGDLALIIRHVPHLLHDRDITNIIKHLFADLLEEKNVKQIDNQTNRMLSFLACRSAIKAGDQLTQKQAKELISQISHFDTLYTCPHGRPLKIELSLQELSRLFKRS